MQKDTKVLLISLAFTLLLIVGAAFLMGGAESTPLTEVVGVNISPQPSDWGDVDINGGIVTRGFDVKNETKETIKLKKIVTSCMCTEANASAGEKETRYFGMEHPGDRNAPVNLEIPAGDSVKITVNFDPAAHGPEGTGPFERVVELTFSDPAGIKEIAFDGVVVSE